jgi:enoyl-CoA hydratase
MSQMIEVTREGQHKRVSLNRPNKLNAFNTAMVDELLAVMRESHCDGTRMLVFDAVGKGFSGGFDLDGLAETSDGDMLLRFVRVEELLQAVFYAPFATMALVHGACFGAAADLVSACHFSVATPDAKFRMPGPMFGVVLGTHRLGRLVGATVARKLLACNVPFSAEDAARCGFIQSLATTDDWPELTEQACASVHTLDADTYALVNARLNDDSRAADMDALVRSVASGSITARLSAYVETVQRARAAVRR